MSIILEEYSWYCPTCNVFGEHALIERVETYTLGEVNIPVKVTLRVCKHCGAEYDTSDILFKVYEEYEKLTGKKWKGIYDEGK